MALQPNSLANQIASLGVGETVSKTRMFVLGGIEQSDLNDAKRRMRNHMNKHQERASRETGATFRLDTGLWLSHENTAAFLTVAITRMM
jgi:hypothetical protein